MKIIVQSELKNQTVITSKIASPGPRNKLMKETVFKGKLSPKKSIVKRSMNPRNSRIVPRNIDKNGDKNGDSNGGENDEKMTKMMTIMTCWMCQ